MNPKGTTCTLYPMVLDGADVPPGYDPRAFVQPYMEALVDRLTKRGFIVKLAASGVADEGLVVTLRLVRIKKASSAAAIFYTMGALGALMGQSFAGGVEISGAIGTAQSPLASLYVKSSMPPLGRSEAVMKTAAKAAGLRMAGEIEKRIKGLPALP